MQYKNDHSPSGITSVDERSFSLSITGEKNKKWQILIANYYFDSF